MSDILTQGLHELKLSLALSQVAQIERYLQLLAQWNAVINLTAVRDHNEQIVRHVLDCLSVVPHLPEDAAPLYDIGSGAGLPGLMLAIARPDWSVHLVESSHKKSQFLRQVIIDLRLEHCSVHAERVQDVHPKVAARSVICRALSDVGDFIHNSRHLGNADTLFYAMKGKKPQDELAALPADVRLRSLHEVSVPFLEEQRCLLCLSFNTFDERAS